MHDWLTRSARRFPDKEALILQEQRWTYRALDEHTRRLAAALNRAGLKRHDRVVILLGNSCETVISIYGILKAGGAFVNLEGSVKAAKLRYIMENTGAALPVEHIKSLRTLLPDVRIFSMFGLTECKRVGYLHPDEIDKRPASVGTAMPNCETSIVDDDGNELATGQTGELVIRGSNVMQGYWQSPELTTATYRDGKYPADRRLHSGDYFRRDEDNFLYFVGRKDDMIKSKGERISPKEVENNISTMGGVAEVAVIGVGDEIFGQAIKAFIVPASGKELTEKEVLRFCTANMESFMVPKYVQFMDQLPRTPNGKIDKRTLKARSQGESEIQNSQGLPEKR